VPQDSEQQRCMSLAHIAQYLTELAHVQAAPGVFQKGEVLRQVSSSKGPHGIAVTTPGEKPLLLDMFDPLLLDTLCPLLLDPLPLIIANACTIRAAVTSAPSPFIM